MKRIFILCDGTWQSELNKTDTNIMQILQMLEACDASGVQQIKIYEAGVGSTEELAAHATGGISGVGLDDIIQNAYTNLSANYQEGDDVYILGFSRGSYIARSLAGFIRKCGLLSCENLNSVADAYLLYRNKNEEVDGDAANAFRTSKQSQPIPIKAICCFDTVGAMGFPNAFPVQPLEALIDHLNAKYKFYDTQLNKYIQYAFHAISLDERRSTFVLTPMQTSPNNPGQVLKQVWFAGCHSDVGGGEPLTVTLANGPLLWMITEMRNLGVAFDTLAVDKVVSLPLTSYTDTATGIPFGGLPKIPRALDASSNTFHRNVYLRLAGDSGYNPLNVPQGVRDQLAEIADLQPDEQLLVVSMQAN